MRANDNAYQAIFNAASVLSLDNKIAAWLGENDPKALAQLRGAIKAVQAEIDQRTALEALAEKFHSVTDITFLTPVQEAAVLGLLESVLDTLTMRGRDRLTQKLAADLAIAFGRYQIQAQAERAAARVQITAGRHKPATIK